MMLWNSHLIFDVVSIQSPTTISTQSSERPEEKEAQESGKDVTNENIFKFFSPAPNVLSKQSSKMMGLQKANITNSFSTEKPSEMDKEATNGRLTTNSFRSGELLDMDKGATNTQLTADNVGEKSKVNINSGDISPVERSDKKSEENFPRPQEKPFEIHFTSADEEVNNSISSSIETNITNSNTNQNTTQEGKQLSSPLNNNEMPAEKTKTVLSSHLNDNEMPAEKTKMVLILTESRHGSTWLMDLLSYPETSVPLFEPLNTPFLKMYAISEDVRAEALQEGYDPAEYGDWREVILARICLCDFTGKKIESGRKYGGIHGLGYKAKRKGTDLKKESAISVAMCDHKESLIVPKTIRLYNITELSLLPELGCHNFKIIHLVRDPRAVLLSRMKVFHELYDGNKLLGEHLTDQVSFSEEYMRRAARDLCSHHVYNYQIGMNPPDWLKDRYKMVKYEDIAADPDRWARDLLHFVGARYTAVYKEYVYNTSHIHARGQKDKGSYAVERESKEILNSWRGYLIESHWKTIEEECQGLMRIMGYQPDLSDTKL